MQHQSTTKESSMLQRTQKTVMAVLALAAIAVGASAIAQAASKGSSGSGSSTTPTPQTNRNDTRGQNGIPPQRSDETPLTGDTADKVQKAALAKVPGATVLRVETDAEGSPYEAHLRKSDGSEVTVKVNKQFEATSVEQGFGGGPGGHGGPDGTAGTGGGQGQNPSVYGAPGVSTYGA
jgi:hypothetical protein